MEPEFASTLRPTREHDGMSRAVPSKQKKLGAYYTPSAVAQALVRWVVRHPTDELLDPSCGDGEFLACHDRVVGVDFDTTAIAHSAQRVPKARLIAGDFFEWASTTNQRFECVAGNPPFIRYQRFAGSGRQLALRLCRRQGVDFSQLTSSWAPFLVGASGLLKPGGRMAFVVPAEIGHCTYSRPLIEHLISRFGRVVITAIREKVFPDLSEDVWLLRAENAGSETSHLEFQVLERFRPSSLRAAPAQLVSRSELVQSNYRLRPFLLRPEARAVYSNIAGEPDTARLGGLARVGIGYVTGANDFFHLRPSTALRAQIPENLLVPSVRSGKSLKHGRVDNGTVESWKRKDEPVLLLKLSASERPPLAVIRYLDSTAGKEARNAYKCRVRDPWYVVPSVNVPDGFLSYMSGDGPILVQNGARCVGTNSVHLVTMKGKHKFSELAARWCNTLTRFSCEIEGHPLGGGMLKVEPGEASRIVLPHLQRHLTREESNLLEEGFRTLRAWRHYV